MEQIKKKQKSKIDLLLILALIILARVSCPALSNIPIFSIAFTFLYGAAFVVLFLLTVGEVKKQDLGLLLCVMLYTVYIVVRDIGAGKGLFARDAFNAYIIVFLTVIYIWSKGKPLGTRILLFRLIYCALIFDYVYSIIVLLYDPNASRLAAATSVLEPSQYDILNAVGSFDAVYGGITIVLILLCMRKILKKQNAKDILTTLVLVLSLVFIVMASYGTAFVLLIIALGLYLSQKRKVLSGFLIVFAILIFIFHEQFGQMIIDFSASISGWDTVSSKLQDMGEMLKTFEAAGTYAGEDGRAANMVQSLSTFWKYPIFGGIGAPDAKVGGHSELLDLLGRFGLVGFSLVVTFFVALYRNVKAGLLHADLKRTWNIMYVVFILSAILNPSLYSLQMMPMILMISLAPSYIEACATPKLLRRREEV